MGKTYKREKTFGPKHKRLNNHRYLPDRQIDKGWDDEPTYNQDEEEEYYAKEICPKERPNIDSQGPTAGQNSPS